MIKLEQKIRELELTQTKSEERIKQHFQKFKEQKEINEKIKGEIKDEIDEVKDEFQISLDKLEERVKDEFNSVWGSVAETEKFLKSLTMKNFFLVTIPVLLLGIAVLFKIGG